MSTTTKTVHPPNFPELASSVKESAGGCCVRCGSSGTAEAPVTVFSLNRDLGNVALWNLAPLCSPCTIHIQGHGIDAIVGDGNGWAIPYVAGMIAAGEAMKLPAQWVHNHSSPGMSKDYLDVPQIKSIYWDRSKREWPAWAPPCRLICFSEITRAGEVAPLEAGSGPGPAADLAAATGQATAAAGIPASVVDGKPTRKPPRERAGPGKGG